MHYSPGRKLKEREKFKKPPLNTINGLRTPTDLQLGFHWVPAEPSVSQARPRQGLTALRG